MPLTEQTIVDRLEVLRDGTVQVREANEIIDDATGEVKARSFHRRVVSIEDDAPDLSFADAASQATITAARTPDRVEAARARKLLRDTPDFQDGKTYALGEKAKKNERVYEAAEDGVTVDPEVDATPWNPLV